MDRLLEIFRKFPEFESDRLFFRDILHSDAADLFEIYHNKNALKYQVISPFRSLAEVKRYVDVVHDGYQNRYFIRWGIVEKASGKLIGLISLHHIEFWNYKAEVGYMFNEAFWNKGYATEAVKKYSIWRLDNGNFIKLKLKSILVIFLLYVWLKNWVSPKRATEETLRLTER